MGYVGMANAVLLSQNNEVIAFDVSEKKVEMINTRISPVVDSDISFYLKNYNLNLQATTNKHFAFSNAEFILISVPTNFIEMDNVFDTSIIQNTVTDIKSINPNATIIIKSTVPIGFTKSLSDIFKDFRIHFSPEFLREGKALYDNLYPSRIVIGPHTREAEVFVKLLIEASLKKDVPVIYTNSTEAEAIKLFSNTYLAMRIAFFNELDTFSEVIGLSTKSIIEGVCYDPRIGQFYNNPSFGYGGYCLPKDTRQLLANYQGIPQSIISSIVASNELRISHISDMILEKRPKTVGVYRLIMKSGSDNYRNSAIQKVIEHLKNKDITILIYEPMLADEMYQNIRVTRSFDEFIALADIIITNRYDEKLDNCKNKVYSRDIFSRD